MWEIYTYSLKVFFFVGEKSRELSPLKVLRIRALKGLIDGLAKITFSLRQSGTNWVKGELLTKADQ